MSFALSPSSLHLHEDTLVAIGANSHSTDAAIAANEIPRRRSFFTRPGSSLKIVLSNRTRSSYNDFLPRVHRFLYMVGWQTEDFWDGELNAFAAHHQVIAPDLPGHGESGTSRRQWGIPEFGADICSVLKTEGVKKVVLFGNSLGGPVAIEAALLVPDRVLGVVGVDTFQSLSYTISAEDARKRADAFRGDYAASLRQMVKQLFHHDADPALLAEAERRMAYTAPEAAYGMFLSLAGYDTSESARRLNAPLRAINGDLYPTDFEGARKVKADFDAQEAGRAGARCDYEAHGPLPDARTTGGVRPACGRYRTRAT